MAIEDLKNYTLKGSQIKDLASRIKQANPTLDQVLDNGYEATDKPIILKDSLDMTHLDMDQTMINQWYDDGNGNGNTTQVGSSMVYINDYSQYHNSDITINPGALSFSASDNATGDSSYLSMWADPGLASTVDMSDDMRSAWKNALDINVDDTMSDSSTNAVRNSTIKSYVDTADSSLQSQIDSLGEMFRVKNWSSNTLNVQIPVCTSDVANTSIPKMEFSISDEEGADYQIVGMVAYEVFDASSNRINCWPVCQFTGNGQKTLTVRWMCAGTSAKTAKRLNAWVLLKHR